MKPIWEAELDNRYACKVTRVHEYAGLLTVIDTTNGNKLLEEEVTLSFAAIFGADYADIMEWENKILDYFEQIDLANEIVEELKREEGSN
jgi:hypothetical protein